MRLDKYANDFRLENKENKNGKLKTVAVYHGKLYRFIYPQNIAYAAEHYLFCTLLLCVLFILPFSVTVETMRKWYALVPYALNALAIFYLAASVARIVKTAGGLKNIFSGRDAAYWQALRLTRENNDKIYARVARCTFIILFFTCSSLIGGTVAAVIEKSMVTGDWIFLASALVSAAAALHLFLIKEFFRTEEDTAGKKDKAEPNPDKN